MGCSPGRPGLRERWLLGPCPAGMRRPSLPMPKCWWNQSPLPGAAARRRRDQPDRLVVLAPHLVGLAVPPRRGAERFRPGIGVALALDADQHGGGGVLVRLGIAAGLVLADPQIEAVAGHERLDP